MSTETKGDCTRGANTPLKLFSPILSFTQVRRNMFISIESRLRSKLTANKYMKDHIIELWRKIRIFDWSSQLQTQPVKAWKKFMPIGAVLYRLSYQATGSWSLCLASNVACRADLEGFLSLKLSIKKSWDTTAQVVCITAMINQKFISFSAVQIYDLKYISNQTNVTWLLYHIFNKCSR